MTRRRMLLAGALLALAVAGGIVGLVVTTPDVDHLRTTNPTQTSFMRLRGEPDRIDWIELDEVSPYLVCAVVKSEDRGFFRHSGFEWDQLRKAAAGYLLGDARIGGSTITQQLARNLYLGPERSLRRKLREALITRRLERALDKRRILELYLNAAEWGDGVWGVKEAARVHFGKRPAELALTEAIALASMLPAPRAPLAGRNLERAQKVQRRVLHQMRVSNLLEQRLDLSTVLASGCGIADELLATQRARLSRRARRKP